MKRSFFQFGNGMKKNLFHTKRLRIKRNIPAALAAGVVLCLLILLLTKIMPHNDQHEETILVLTAQSVTIHQGENIPELKAKAAFADGTERKKKKTILSKEADYSVQDLLVDLNQGEGYEVDCNADGSEEGKFKIYIRLSGELKSSVESEWKGKVIIQTRTGNLTVEKK